MTSDSKISATDGDEPVIDMAALGARLTARRAVLGNPELPRNGGSNRTESKRALLKAIKATGRQW